MIKITHTPAAAAAAAAASVLWYLVKFTLGSVWFAIITGCILYPHSKVKIHCIQIKRTTVSKSTVSVKSTGFPYLGFYPISKSCIGHWVWNWWKSWIFQNEFSSLIIEWCDSIELLIIFIIVKNSLNRVDNSVFLICLAFILRDWRHEKIQCLYSA